MYEYKNPRLLYSYQSNWARDQNRVGEKALATSLRIDQLAADKTVRARTYNFRAYMRSVSRWMYVLIVIQAPRVGKWANAGRDLVRF